MLLAPEAVSDDIASAATRMQALYDVHAKAEYRLLLRLTFGERQAAEDLIQETMLRAWRKIDALDANTTPPFRPGKPEVTLTDCHRRWRGDGLSSAGDVDAACRVIAHAVGISYGTQQSVIDEVYDDSHVVPVQAFDVAMRPRLSTAQPTGEAAAQALGIKARDLCRAAGGSGGDRNDPPVAAADRARKSRSRARTEVSRLGSRSWAKPSARATRDVPGRSRSPAPLHQPSRCKTDWGCHCDYG
jgi:Sigma-70 region 2